MLILEFKAYGKSNQFSAIEEALKTAKFIQNKCLQYWMDNNGLSKYDLNKYCTVLAKKFAFANELNSMARQACAERAWSAISRFYENCKKQISGKKGFPRFKKNIRSVEYKTTGWKLSEDRKSIQFTDGKQIGRLKLKGTRDLHFYQIDQIKRVRLVKRADGCYVQFVISEDRFEAVKPSGGVIGLDVGLSSFYTDSNNQTVDNPRFFRKGEKRIKQAQRNFNRKVKGSNNRLKAKVILGKYHLKISRQRKDFAVKLARCVIKSNDLVAYEDLSIKNMGKNHCLAKSINDTSWYQFRLWLEYFGKVFGKITIAVPPQGTSQECYRCGTVVKKSLSARTHICQCGCVLDRDHNAAINILSRGLATVGHTGSYGLEPCNAWGEAASTLAGAILSKQVTS